MAVSLPRRATRRERLAAHARLAANPCFAYGFSLAVVCLIVMFTLWGETGSGPVVQAFAYASILIASSLLIFTVLLLLYVR